MYLLDTNIYIRYISEPHKLPGHLLTVLKDPAKDIFVSAVVPWEIAIKYTKGKLAAGALILPNHERFLSDLGMTELEVTGKHGVHAGQLPPIHQDPFDRMIIAQAQLEALTILTLDKVFSAYGVSVINQ